MIAIDRTYVLNLDRRVEKWERSRDLLRSVGLDPVRFPAMDGETLHDDPAAAAFRHIGALGCLRSHAAIIRDAQARGFRRIAVFEDDILPRKDFDWSVVDKLSDWRFVYLGATQADWSAVEIQDGYYRPANTLGTWAMLIDSQYFDKLLHLYDATKSADLSLSTALFHDPQAYVLWPYLFITDVSISDIRDWGNVEQLHRLWHWTPECYASPRSFTASGLVAPCLPSSLPTVKAG